jgi:hypothetical protein
MKIMARHGMKSMAWRNGMASYGEIIENEISMAWRRNEKHQTSA